MSMRVGAGCVVRVDRIEVGTLPWDYMDRCKWAAVFVVARSMQQRRCYIETGDLGARVVAIRGGVEDCMRLLCCSPTVRSVDCMKDIVRNVMMSVGNTDTDPHLEFHFQLHYDWILTDN